MVSEMYHRRTNLLIWFSTALLLAGAVAALATGLLLPLEDSAADIADAHHSSRPANPAAAALPPLSAFEPLWSRKLRQSEATSPAPTVEANATPATNDASQQQLVLTGTIGDSLAIFRLPDGTTVLKSVGDEIGNAQVVSIQPARVRLRQANREIELSKPLASDPSTTPSNQ